MQLKLNTIMEGQSWFTQNRKNHNQQKRYWWISWIRNIKSSCTSAISCNRYNWQIWCISKRSWWWIYRTGWSNPSWYFQSFITGWWRIPFNIKESWILNKRPKNERKKETRSSQSTSCTTVLKTLIIRYGRYEEYTEPFNGEIYWKAFSFYQRI